MQFGIRKLLLFVTAAAMVCAMLVGVRNEYYEDRRLAESVLAKVEGISEITLHSFVDVFEEVNS